MLTSPNIDSSDDPLDEPPRGSIPTWSRMYTDLVDIDGSVPVDIMGAVGKVGSVPVDNVDAVGIVGSVPVEIMGAVGKVDKEVFR